MKAIFEFYLLQPICWVRGHAWKKVVASDPFNLKSRKVCLRCHSDSETTIVSDTYNCIHCL